MLPVQNFLVIQLSIVDSQTEVGQIVNILQVCCFEQVETGHLMKSQDLSQVMEVEGERF